MAVSRRLRFEILRRDGHTCRYCGASAPDVKLTVDHVVPQALGGKDEPENLVTACQPCNAGKSSTNPDTPLVADVEADALRWAAARTVALADWREAREVLTGAAAEFGDAWDAWGAGEGDDRVSVPRDSAWRDSFERWIEEGFEVEDLIDLIPKAMHSRPGRDGGPIPMEERWRYYCGVVWRTLDRIQEATAAALTDANEPDGDRDDGLAQAYDDGFVDGRAYERNQAGLVQYIEVRNSEPRMCIECDDRPEHLATGMCAQCWDLEGHQQSDHEPEYA